MFFMDNFIDPGNIARTEHEVHRRSPLDDLLPQMTRCTATYTYFGTLFFLFVENAYLRKELGDRFFTHTAGIDDDEIGITQCLCQFIGIFTIEFCDHMFTVTCIHSTTERFYKEFFHGFTF